MALLDKVAKLGTANILFVFTLFLTPIARYILPLFKTRKSNAIFHLFTGIFVAIYLFKEKFSFAIAFAVLGFYLIRIRPLHAFIVAAVANSLIHVYYILYAQKSWSMEVTGMTIIIFQKIVTLSFNLADGKELKEKKKLKRPRCEQFSVSEIPSALEWFSYCFTPFGGSTGPLYEFKVFRFILDQGTRPKTRVPLKPIMYRIFHALLAAVCVVFGAKYFGYKMYSQDYYLQSNVLIRMILTIVATSFQAVKYFTVWNAVVASMIQLGVSDSPLFEKDLVDNYNLFYDMMSESCAMWMQRWNHTAHLFWKNYLFLRLLDANYPYTVAHNSVFIASAVWHGFKPSYYVILPETLLAMVADRRLNTLYPLTEKTSVLVRTIRRIWAVSQLLASTSTWWSGTVESYFQVRMSNAWGFQIVAVFVLIYTYIIEFTRLKFKKVPKEEKMSAKKNE